MADLATPGIGKGGAGSFTSRTSTLYYLLSNGQLVTPAQFQQRYGSLPSFLRPTGGIRVTETVLTQTPVGIAKPASPLVPPPAPYPFPKAPVTPSPVRAEVKGSGPIFVAPDPAPRFPPRVQVAPAPFLGAAPTQKQIRRAFGSSRTTAFTLQQLIVLLELAEANLQTAGFAMDAIEALQLEQGFGAVTIGKISYAAAKLTQAYLFRDFAQMRVNAAAKAAQAITPSKPASEELKKLRAQTEARRKAEIEAAFRKQAEGIRQIAERVKFVLQATGRTGANNPLFLMDLSINAANRFLAPQQGGIDFTLALAGLPGFRQLYPSILTPTPSTGGPMAQLATPAASSGRPRPSVILGPNGKPIAVLEGQPLRLPGLPDVVTLAGLAAVQQQIQQLTPNPRKGGLSTPPTPGSPGKLIGGGNDPNAGDHVVAPDFTRPSGSKPSDP